ncbi:MAG: GntR family transcriptional regulator [Pseudonocardiaceae bacterium]
MEPQRTPALAPIALRVADDLRIEIETGRLAPGDSLPTLYEITQRWKCSITSARTAVALLKQQGLITGGRGRAPVVRAEPPKVERTSLRHQAEKDLVRESEEIRRRRGLAEDDLHGPLDGFDFTADYTTEPAGPELSEMFGIGGEDLVLRREFEHKDLMTGDRAAWSVSWIPESLITANPMISDPTHAAWPGGTMHALSTVGIEIDGIVDEATATMPTTVEASMWALPEGVPLLWVRRISIDTTGRVVEISDAQYPADRTKLTFHTRLTRWDTNG